MFRRCIQLTAYSAVGLLLSGGGAVRHAECQDVVTITKASYNVKKSKLRVHATSSDQPGALLTLVGFGQMNWKNDKYEYKENPVECPDSVTVISDYGGSATAVVCGPPPMPSPTPTPTDPPPTLTPIPLPPPIIIGFKHDLVAGPNVNMVSGTTWPDGDPFL